MLLLRNIYNEFIKIRYKTIVSKTLVDRVAEELENIKLPYRAYVAYL